MPFLNLLPTVIRSHSRPQSLCKEFWESPVLLCRFMEEDLLMRDTYPKHLTPEIKKKRTLRQFYLYCYLLENDATFTYRTIESQSDRIHV